MIRPQIGWGARVVSSNLDKAGFKLERRRHLTVNCLPADPFKSVMFSWHPSPRMYLHCFGLIWWNDQHLT